MYIVLEFQTDSAGNTAVVPPAVFATSNEAKSRYHQILSVAAISSVYKHTAAIMYSNGTLIESESFDHIPEPVPELEEVVNDG